jgi:hypothetical protein
MPTRARPAPSDEDTDVGEITKPVERGVTTKKLTRMDALLPTDLPPAPPPMPSLNAPPPTDARATALAWLVCDPLPPIPIGLMPVLKIGRTVECDVVLPHTSVSRVHALIRTVDGRLHFEDQSTYGSYVNGERAVSCEVAAGDTITIGPYELKVLPYQSVSPQTEAPESETRPIGLSISALPSTEAMSGRIEKQPLTEVLQSIEFNRKSGTLELFCGEVKGMLVVYEGAPIFANFGSLESDVAVTAMVCQPTGYYTFGTKIEPGDRTIQKSLTALLLEASRQLDEKDED